MTHPLDLLSASEREHLRQEGQPQWTVPMLATLTDKRFSDAAWVFERKFDGERALACRKQGHVRLLSRNKRDIAATYPELVEALAEQSCEDFIADGEIVAFDGPVTSFSKLQRRMQIEDPEDARRTGVTVTYYLFDLLYLDGYALDDLPLRARKKLLKRAIAFHDPLRYTPHRNQNGEAYYQDACEKGWEGVIAKRADAPYRHSRSRDWLKFKCAKGQELVIGGFTEPMGSREGFGALLVGYYQGEKLRYAGKVGTGFDDQLLVSLRARLDRIARSTPPFADDVREQGVTWVRPELVAAFGFTEWTRAGKLRHPRFLGLRRDKAAREVVRECAEPGL
jgi:bifunctional non-homologous end joining protein LigD